MKRRHFLGAAVASVAACVARVFGAKPAEAKPVSAADLVKNGAYELEPTEFEPECVDINKIFYELAEYNSRREREQVEDVRQFVSSVQPLQKEPLPSISKILDDLKGDEMTGRFPGTEKDRLYAMVYGGALVAGMNRPDLVRPSKCPRDMDAFYFDMFPDTPPGPPEGVRRPRRAEVYHEVWTGTIDELVAQFRQRLEIAAEECRKVEARQVDVEANQRHLRCYRGRWPIRHREAWEDIDKQTVEIHPVAALPNMYLYVPALREKVLISASLLRDADKQLNKLYDPELAEPHEA